MADRSSKRVVLAIGLAGVVVLGVVLASAPASSSSCVQSPDYGTQCESISGVGLRVTRLVAKFTTVPDFFTQHAWTFETTTYRCDPRGRTKKECRPDHRVYGTLHHRNPRNRADTVCTSAGTNARADSCSGSLRFTVPRTFPTERWLCVEIAVYVNGGWVDNGAALSQGDRACKHVH